MCGIIGCIGEKRVVPILLQGLKRLEYRGYDSSGICVINNPEKSPKLQILKRKGRISELENSSQIKNIRGKLGIAHTRWATHGEPNEINAHPHSSMDDIAIVHNGIIENYLSLRAMLKREGYNIVSETDSEIIAHLIHKFYSGNLETAVRKAVQLLEGAFALAIVHRKEEKIVVARKGSPIIIGVGNSEMYAASDVSAILPYTRKVVYLNDNEIAILTKTGYFVENTNGDEVKKKVHNIKWNIGQLEKKGFKHFMLKEIFEQPNAISSTLRGRLGSNGKIKLNIDIDFDSIQRIIITACGTSWHSALIGKTIIEKINRIPVEVDYASEFRYRNPIVKKGDLVIVISQSGETADTLAALREAKKNGAKTLGIVNVVGSTIAREMDTGIYLQAGPEIGVASTKAFTTQVMDLLLLSLYMKQQQGGVDPSLMEEISSLSRKIPEVLKQSENIRKIAEKIDGWKNMLYLGRGINFPVALEGALKLKEISYIHAEGYPAAEMKHGPIALIDRDMPVVFVAPKDHTYEKILSNMEEIRARGGKIVAIITEDDESIRKLAEDVILVPKCCDELSPIINVIPLQLLAYHVADMKGIDVDKPRNLAKSVTVE